MRTRCGRSRGGGFGERLFGARGGNLSVRCGGQLPLHLRTETSLRDIPVFRPAYSALPKRSDFSRFAAYEGELRMLLQTLL